MRSGSGPQTNKRQFRKKFHIECEQIATLWAFFRRA